MATKKNYSVENATKNMKLCLPYKTNGLNPFITQGYKEGHKAIDFASSYGTFMVAPEDVVVERIINAQTIDEKTEELSRGYGIVMRACADPMITHLYWHCLPCFPVKEGEWIGQGKIVAQMGNSGFCMTGGKIVPIEGRLKPPYPGTHLHWEVKKNGEFLNFLGYIDRTIPIKYSFMDVIKASQNIMQGIINLIKGRN